MRLSAASSRVGSVASADELEPTVDSRHDGRFAWVIAEDLQQRLVDTRQVDGRP